MLSDAADNVDDVALDGLEALRALHVLRVVSTSPRLRTLVDTAAMVLFPTLQFGAIYLSITYGTKQLHSHFAGC